MRARRRGRRGFTLVEMMVVIMFLPMVLLMLYGLASDIGDLGQWQQRKTTAQDEARKGLLTAVRDLRQAAENSLSDLPAPSLSYRVATDVDGNGLAVDDEGRLELSTTRTLSRDHSDLNGDGFTANQLVWTEGERVRVLATGLVPDEDGNGNGMLDEGEDGNGNGRLDRGLWFERAEGTVRVTIQTQRKTRRGRVLVVSLDEFVAPRN